MKIEKLESYDINNVEVGDLLESEFTGNMYLITELDNGKFGCVNLANDRICNGLYDTITDLVRDTVDDYILHKKDRVKLVIE